jgi:NADH:ubiquinone oxidoreductase subunit 4 (subunit M)
VALGHKYVSTLMFLIVGTIYHRRHKRVLFIRSGLTGVGYRVIGLINLVMLSNKAIPPSISFFGELIFLRTTKNK